MFTVPITYINPDDQTVTKDFYFNITKAEIALTQLESDGDWAERIGRIKGSNKGSVVIPEFKKIIEWTYGERRGDSFVKNKEVWDLFEHSEAWSALIMMFFDQDDPQGNFAAKFITGVMPPDMRGAAQEAIAEAGFRPGANTDRPTPRDPAQQSAPASVPVAEPIAAPVESVKPVEEAQTTVAVDNAQPAPAPVEDVQRTSTPREGGEHGEFA